MRTTIRMDEELRRRAQQFAKHRGRTFTDLVTDAVREFIARPEQKVPPERIVLPTAGNPNGKKITDRELRAMIEEMYEEDARRIFKGEDSE